MIRDQTPHTNLGFGIVRSQLPNQEEIEAVDPNAGILERSLHDRPYSKFFAHAAATIVGASVAGALVKGVGKRALRHLAIKSAYDRSQGLSSGYVRAFQSFREAQRTLDEYSGVTNRLRGESEIVKGGKKIVFDDPTKDKTITRKGFYFTQAEREKARDLGRDIPAEWTYKDEIRERLIRQARRLPYELPAAYVTQRLISDPLLGTGPEEPINWTNPIDVIGDFAQQSIKNLAFAMLPFEAGVGATQHAWRKHLTDATAIGFGGSRSATQELFVGVNASLELIGHQASDLISKSVMKTRQTTGAMAHAITYAATKQKPLVEHLHQMRKHGASRWMHRWLSGEESFGAVSQMRDLRRGFLEGRDLVQRRATQIGQEAFGFGGTPLERIAGSISSIAGKKIGDIDDPFITGKFFQVHAQSQFKRTLAEELSSRGVDSSAASDFVNLFKFSLPRSADSKMHLSRRLYRNGQAVFEGSQDWTDALKAEIRPRFDGQSSAIATSIEDAIKAADARFIGRMPTMRRQLERAWRESYIGPVAQQVKRTLGTRKAAYGDFGLNISRENAEWLVRRSAERIGIPLASGRTIRSTNELRRDLARRGFDPNDRYQLRSFLVEQGDISKPWNPSGTNIFGLRALSVQEALDNNLFQSDSPLDREIRTLARNIQRSDYDPNILNRLRVGGVYTAGSNIINFNPLRESARNFFNTIANETQIPFIHVNPASLFGYQFRQSIDEGPAVRLLSGNAASRTLTRTGSDSFIWFKGGRGKGTAIGLNIADDGAITTQNVGTFRPTPDTGDSIAGRALRHAFQQSGRAPRVPRTGFRDFFDVDENQPASLFNYVQRFRNRKNDPRNVGAFAARLLSKDLPTNVDEIAEGTQTLLQYWQNSSFTQNFLRSLDQNHRISSILRTSDDVSVFDLDFADLHQRMMQTMRDQTTIAELPRAQRQIVERARRNLLQRWERLEDPSVLNSALPKTKRSLGLHRRIDEARMDYIRYLAIEKHALYSPKKFGEYIDELIGEVGELHGRGLITSREAAENRAALGSIYASFISMEAYSPTISTQQQLLQVANQLKNKVPGISVNQGISKVIEDTANYGRVGAIKGKIRQRFGAGPYEYDGFQFQPLSQDEVLVPTFSTAYERNPIRSILNLTGFTTWSDPENFSGSSMAVSHLFDRLNRALYVFNMGLDPTKYSGPIGMYAQGLIGKRALPLVAAGATFMAVDRTLGAYVLNDRDQEGRRIYQPLVVGTAAEVVKEAQVALTGLIPGGQTAAEKRYELEEGEVAVRSGRYWPIGSTPFFGGKVEYYRPSWYRQIKSGYQYTEQTFGSPLERLLFGYDFSPLRPLDPYRFEREHLEDRPYPVSGDYFTGPWGPLTSVLNATVGRLLKPRRMMHEDELQAGLSTYVPVGQSGMAPLIGTTDVSYDRRGNSLPSLNASLELAAQSPAYLSGSAAAGGELANINDAYLAAAYGTNIYSTQLLNYPYINNLVSPYTVVNPRTPSGVVSAVPFTTPSSLGFQFDETAYRLQELAGIYGFAFGALREGLGFGHMEYEHTRPVLASASQAYGMSRQFWDLNLGGLGDFPTPLEGEYANIEISEIVRRFIPKPRDLNYVNPISNQLGRVYPWLPGNDYMINFHQGDPFAAIPQGEMRLPGPGYERFNNVVKDPVTGQYSLFDQFEVLADTAPYSNQFRMVTNALGESNLTPEQRRRFDEVLQQVDTVKRRHEFVSYEDREDDPFRAFTHANTYFNTKLLPHRTATEDWERFNVYGNPFPTWHNPIESFITPSLNRARDRNPLMASAIMGFVGRMFGSTARAKTVGGVAGSLIGLFTSTISNVGELVTGERFLPKQYREQVRIEEYIDILKYTRALRGFAISQQTGNDLFANYFKEQMQSTMYGADLLGASVDELAQAIPKRKREHFMEMIHAPEHERERILSTAGRLERRIYQAAWGMRVERRPALDEFFAEHELPPPTSDIWDPRTSMEQVEIKMLQNQGINPSSMGYFPQQVDMANIFNPPYPDIDLPTENPRIQLLRLLEARGMSGDIQVLPNPFGQTRVELYSGV